jgi:putative transposase
MPRKLRVEYHGAMYHVMSRGDQREDIFLNDVDRHDFLKTLAEACQKTGWQIHAYCLMRNHYHVVLETPGANLVAGMAWLQSTYTIRLNHRHKLHGHVFSGRYKAQVVDGSGDGYLRTACDYVHLNPVRARLLRRGERLLAYPWSSLGYYLASPKHRPQWIRVDRWTVCWASMASGRIRRRDGKNLNGAWRRGGWSPGMKRGSSSCDEAGAWEAPGSKRRC